MPKKKNGSSTNKKKCFFITPIDDKNSPFRGRMQFVNQHILMPVLGNVYEIEVGTRRSAPVITAIVQHIFESDLIVSDLTGWNANVAYELGLAHTLGKPTIHLFHGEIKSDSLPFDLRGVKAISYPHTDKIDAKTNLAIHSKDINATKKKIREALRNIFSNPISDVLSYDDLANYFVGKFNGSRNLSEVYDFLHKMMSNTIEKLTGQACTKAIAGKLAGYEKQIYSLVNLLCEHLHGSGRLYIVDQFIRYCALCESMVHRADPRDERGIITVQTPVKTDNWDQDYEDAYEKYIATTISKIVNTSTRYRRLVIANDDLDRRRIKKFVRDLIAYAQKQRKRSLNNVWIGFVHPSNSFYSNIDFHITSEKDCSIAFLSQSKPQDFNSSLHLHDLDGKFPDEMRKEMLPLWNIHDENVIKINKFYSLTKNKKDIDVAIFSKIDNIVAKIS